MFDNVHCQNICIDYSESFILLYSVINLVLHMDLKFNFFLTQDKNDTIIIMVRNPLQNISKKLNYFIFTYMKNNKQFHQHQTYFKTMTVSKVLNIYIPRMLGTINKQIVIDTFHSLHIGCVNYIDMHKRVNENNNSYYF